MGSICLLILKPVLVQVKHLYLKPTFRAKRTRNKPVGTLVEETGKSAIRTRLDSARGMANAQGSYGSFGFREIAPYPESKMQQELHAHWIFMELSSATR